VGVCHFRVELRDINKGESTTLSWTFWLKLRIKRSGVGACISEWVDCSEENYEKEYVRSVYPSFSLSVVTLREGGLQSTLLQQQLKRLPWL
jgi:hypothetical protein